MDGRKEPAFDLHYEIHGDRDSASICNQVTKRSCDGKGREGEPPWAQRWNSVGTSKRRLEMASHAQNPLRCNSTAVKVASLCCGVEKGLDSPWLPLGSVVWARMAVQHPRTYLLQVSNPHMGAASLK
jgi:hypothetical protein